MADNKKAKKDDALDDRAPPLAADMPVTGDIPDAEEDAPAPFSRKKLIIFVLVPILVLAIAGGAAYYFGLLDKMLGHKKLDCTQVLETDKDYAACADELAKAAAAAPPGVFVDIPSMIVNLNSTSKQPRFLKITLKVELEDPATEKLFETVLPRVVDQFQTYLRELRLEDLRGSSGMYRMKIELLSRVRAAAPDIKVRDVLFQEILVQ